MKTDELVSLLAGDVAPVNARATQRQFIMALVAGLPVSFVLMQMWLGVRSDLAAASHLGMFWLKLALPAVLAGAGYHAITRLTRPSMRASSALPVAAMTVAVIWLMGAISIASAGPGARMELILGESWAECPLNILVLSLPVFATAIGAARHLAPTRPALAGAAAGLFAGGAGATVYALHCPEMEAPFLAVWYVLGMALPVAIGAILGPRLLRW